MGLLPRHPHSSYYDSSHRPNASLHRARQPYLIKNAVSGACIFALVGAIYVFTIRAIGQDDFSDVPMPAAPVQTGASVASTPSPPRKE